MVCFVNKMPAGRAFSCFTSNTSSHQEEREREACGERLGVGGCSGGRRVMRGWGRGDKKKDRSGELEEKCGEARGGTEARMWMENSSLFLGGRPAPEQRSERRQQWRKNTEGGKRVETREHETQEGTEEKVRTMKIMREREGQGRPGAVFPPCSLSGSGETRELAWFHCKTRLHIKSNLHPLPQPPCNNIRETEEKQKFLLSILVAFLSVSLFSALTSGTSSAASYT